MITVGEKVYVKTPLFEGMAIVDYIAPEKDGELFPIQVVLDQPDTNGHKVLRVNKYEITHPALTTHLKRFLARVVESKYSYTVGDEYVISEPRADGFYSVYLTSRPDHGPVGSYVTNFFEIIKPIEVTPTRVNDMPKTVARRTKIVNKSQKKEPYEQLTLF